MSTYSQGQLGAGTFWSRQLSTVADSLPGIISSGIRNKSKGGPPQSPGARTASLPEVNMKPSRLPLYLGLGAVGLVLLSVLKRRK
jgi:hypothetical protein